MAANGVKFLIVGGYAVTKYAEPRYTKDLDLWVLADADNAQRIYSTLRAFGAPLTNISPNDFAHEGYFYQMGVPPVRWRHAVALAVAGKKYLLWSIGPNGVDNHGTPIISHDLSYKARHQVEPDSKGDVVA